MQYKWIRHYGKMHRMRVNSEEIFRVNPNGTFVITRPIKIGGNYFDNVIFSRGVRVGDIDLTSLVGRDLEVEDENGVYVVTGYYE
jgi:hypothetical protein